MTGGERRVRAANFTKTPKKSFAIAEFMHRIGTLKYKPESWKDHYFPKAHGEKGD